MKNDIKPWFILNGRSTEVPRFWYGPGPWSIYVYTNQFKPLAVMRVSNWDMHELIFIFVKIHGKYTIFFWLLYSCIIYSRPYPGHESWVWHTLVAGKVLIYIADIYRYWSIFFAVNIFIFLVTYFQVNFLRFRLIPTLNFVVFRNKARTYTKLAFIYMFSVPIQITLVFFF